MKYACLFLALEIWFAGGCQTPPPVEPAAPATPEGLKITDLQDPSKENLAVLMTFRVLTYTLPPEAVDKLKEVIDGMSGRDIRAVNQAAFQANGFAVGVCPFTEGARVAQKLARIGAVRTASAALMYPPDSREVLFRRGLQGSEVIRYFASANRAAVLPPSPGFLGWVFSAKPDTRFRGTALVQLYPATWQTGVEDIRLLMGTEPIEYHPIDAGRVLVRVEEGGVILLGPSPTALEGTTLESQLFFLPGERPKMRFFVIICDSTGT